MSGSTRTCESGCLPDDPAPCLGCKLRYWRTERGLSTTIPDGWRGPSVQARIERDLTQARANGYDPVPADTNNPPYSGPVSV